MAKYRKLFLEESAEHLAEIGRALLELEKDVESVESIDMIFRMAHSIKSMAASLGYDSVTEVAHALEDHMEGVRSAGRVEGPGALSLLFRGLECLESMVDVVRDTGEAPPPEPDLIADLSARLNGSGEEGGLECVDAAEPVGGPPEVQAPAGGEAVEEVVAELDPDLAAVMAAVAADGGPKKKASR